LKQACAEAAPEGGVKEFEVGVFCGDYQTEVPEGYFDHLDELRGQKRKEASWEVPTGSITGNSGPVNGSGASKASFRLEVPVNTLPNNTNGSTLLSASNAPRTPENREDIR
jgi:amidophosphoribosyltransferase